jgi:signal transduction histidine kinase
MLKGIIGRVVIFIATAGVAPLVIYGVVSVQSLRESAMRSVEVGNFNVARRTAEQIERYVSTNIQILQAVGADLEGTSLAAWQQDRVLKNNLIRFREFRELTLLDAESRPLASSRVGAPRLQPPGADAIDGYGVSMTPITVDDDLLPTMMVAVRLGRWGGSQGVLLGEFNLIELWRMVDRIRVGEHGYALVVAEDGRLIAHGHPDEKAKIARGENVLRNPMMRALLSRTSVTPAGQRYPGPDGEDVLGVAAVIPTLRWTVVVEQPTAEAYAIAGRLERQLGAAIALALAVTIGIGYLWGRSFIQPIGALMRGTRALSEGNLDERVQIGGTDEFGRLGDAFNSMADRLHQLQEDVRRQERQAMFGRIAVGLVHDLSHPIKNIGNSCKLVLRMYDDPDYRATFKRTVDREFLAIKRVLEDLRNLARPIPLERFPIDINKSVSDVAEAMKSAAEMAGITIETELAPGAVQIEGDLFALGRVYRNLILNGIQATAPGGTITVLTARQNGRATVTVSDTGCGIPPERLGAIFEDFVTTKRRGLGLGLAISKKIVEQLGGRISVESEVGTGTSFVLDFPAREQT